MLYKNWLDQNNGFRELIISDSSIWTLRIIDKESYIHIHPSRYSDHTIRLKANTLKTVLCTYLFEEADSFLFDPFVINLYRQKYLGLSPIKLLGNHNEMESTFNLLSHKIN